MLFSVFGGRRPRWSGRAAAAAAVALMLVAAAAGVARRGIFEASERVVVVDAQLRWAELPPQPRTTSTGALVVEGRLRNLDARRAPLVRVTATFLDAGGAPVGTAVGYPLTWGVPAGEEVPFLVVTGPDARIAGVATRVEEAPEPGLGALTLGAILEGLRT